MATIQFDLGMESSQAISQLNQVIALEKQLASEYGRAVTVSVTGSGKARVALGKVTDEIRAQERATKSAARAQEKLFSDQVKALDAFGRKASENASAQKTLIAGMSAAGKKVEQERQQNIRLTNRHLNEQMRIQDALNDLLREEHTAATATGIKKVGNEVRTATGLFGKLRVGLEKNQFVWQQLSFGVQDAAAVFGTTGVSGAIRAANNNLTQAAAIMGPMIGTVAGLALGIGGPLVASLLDANESLSDQTDAFNSAEEAAKRYEEAFRNLNDEIKNLKEVDVTAQVSEAVIAENRVRAQDAIAEQESLRQQRAALEKQFEEETKAGDTRGQVRVLKKIEDIDTKIALAKSDEIQAKGRAERAQAALTERGLLKGREIVEDEFSGDATRIAESFKKRRKRIGGIGGLTDAERQELEFDLEDAASEAQREAEAKRTRDFISGLPEAPSALDQQVGQAELDVQGKKLEIQRRSLPATKPGSEKGTTVTPREKKELGVDTLEAELAVLEAILAELKLQRDEREHQRKVNPGGR